MLIARRARLSRRAVVLATPFLFIGRQAEAFFPRGAATNGSSPSAIQAVNSNGQTFVTRPDLATGAGGQTFRYSLLRSNSGPITQANRASATVVNPNLPNNAGQLFGGNPDVGGGATFTQANRISASLPMAKLPNGTQLSLYTCLAVYTCKAAESAWYAIVENTTSETVQAGVNSMISPVAETTAAAPVPILFASGSSRPADPTHAHNPIATNTAWQLILQASGSSGGAPANNTLGDYYEFFGDPTMGWCDGMQCTMVALQDAAAGGKPIITLFAQRDTIWTPNWTAGKDNNWAGEGMLNPPIDPSNGNPRFYPFGVARIKWMVDYLVSRYAVNLNAGNVSGDCMGGLGAFLFISKYPTYFAYAEMNLGVFDVSELAVSYAGNQLAIGTTPSLYAPGASPNPLGTNLSTVLLNDGVTPLGGSSGWLDTITAIANYTGDLPFCAISNQRHDGIYVNCWTMQVNGVKQLLSSKQGVVFSWGNRFHEGSQAASKIISYYNWSVFARNKSYPAFQNSSIDDNLGTGTLNGNGEWDGDRIGSVNMGWQWSGNGLSSGGLVDTSGSWACVIENLWMALNPTTIPSDTLAAPLNNSALTFTGAAGNTFNAQNPYWEIDDEIVILSGISGTTYTATARGFTTSAVAHSIGAPIQNLLLYPTGPNGGPYATMTADVTPRFRQNFKPAIGHVCSWSVTYSGGGGASGSCTAVDANGNFTAAGITFKSGQTTTLTITP